MSEGPAKLILKTSDGQKIEADANFLQEYSIIIRNMMEQFDGSEN